MDAIQIWTVDGVLDVVECGALIRRIDTAGPSVAPITTSHGFEMRPDIRNNERVMFDDRALAKRLFDAVRATLPETIGDANVVAANERLRCYRYRPGQYFAPHYDGSFRRDAAEKSELTLIVYLNDDFVGGETRFPYLERTIAPRTGSALLFNHHVLHEGCAVKRGVKYAVRSDIMYRRHIG